MKRVERTNLRAVLACLLVLGAGAGSAFGQVDPKDPSGANPPYPPPTDDTTSPDDADTTAPDGTTQPDATTPPDGTATPGTTAPGTTPYGTTPPPAPPPPSTPTGTYDTSPAPTTAPPPAPVENPRVNVVVVQPEEEESWTKRNGIAISVGGGVSEFTDDGMRSTTGTAGFWEVRGHFGLTMPLGFEVAYIGQAGDVTPRLGPSQDAVLLGNGVEAVARLNLLAQDAVVQPYLFGGAAWKHYSIENADFSTSASGIADEDDVLEIPVGAGLSLRQSGFFGDARFTFRGATSEDLVIGTPDDTPVDDVLSDDDDYLPMHNWQVGARVGYEF